MSLGLTKPGLSAAVRMHPKTGKPIEPVGYVRGKAVWPVLGASSDDPDDPAFTGEGGTEDDDSDDEDEEDDEPKARKAKPSKGKSSRQSEEDDDDEDEDDEEDKRPRAVRQAARYRTRLRAQERENDALKERLRALEDRDKKPDEVASRDLTEARATVDQLTGKNRELTAQLAFFTANTGVQWVDPSDAFALAQREGLFDEVLDEDGTVDMRELRRGLRDLAKRKKHLVKTDDSPKSRGRKAPADETDEDEEDDDTEPRSRRSAPAMNSGRKGRRQAGPTRDQLAAKFPVLNRL